MAWICPQCGSPNGDTVPTCAVCGVVAPQAFAGGPGRTAFQPPAGYGQPAQGGYAPAAPAGYGAARQAGFGTPIGTAQPWRAQQTPTAARGSGARASKARWGCGIAGCLGVALVIAVVATAMYIFVERAQRVADDDDDNDGPRVTRSDDDDDNDDNDNDNDSDDDDDDDDDDGPRHTNSGSLADNVPKQVGGFKAASAKPLTVPGAIDAVLVVYRSGGQEIEHAISVFPSSQGAERNLEASLKRARDRVGSGGEPVKIKSPAGKVIGRGELFRSDPEMLLFRANKTMEVIQGPRGKVVPFFQDLPSGR